VSAHPERRAVADLVRRLSGLPRDRVEEVLRELDPIFVLEVLRALTQGMQPRDRSRVLRIAQRMEKVHSPEDDDELHEFVQRECGFHVPRAGVCQGHCAPFDLMADVYFERGNLDKLAIGNRGSGKTQIVGALHAVNARTKPKYTACTVGAVEAQATRAYNFFKEQVTKERWSRLVRGKVLMSGTEFENGSKVEIVIGNITGVNSPHPVFGHFDEVELLREGVYEEGLNMAQSKDGYRAQNVLTSSWKKPKGFVSELIDATERARMDGSSLPHQVYRWCVWETTERCEHDCDACPFADVVKGQWEDGTPRTFESACKRGSPEPGRGKLKYTDGFVTLEDTLRRFRTLGKRMWESQQESKRPSLEGLVYNCFDEDRHTVERWDPDPALGLIDVGLDFGGSGSYHAASFWQQLDVEVQWGDRRLPVGAHVCFDEVYFKDTGNVEFGRAINRKIEFWRDEHPAFEVSAFYGDPAAYAAREDFAALPTYGAGEAIRVRFVGHQDVEMGIALVFETIADDLVRIDRARCVNVMDEIGGYERNPNTGKPMKDADHLMDASRYRFWTRHSRSRRRKGDGEGIRGEARPRAVITRGDGRVWDQQAIGSVPEYHGATVEEERVPLISATHRYPLDPFG
jgi:hypothetical protein